MAYTISPELWEKIRRKSPASLPLNPTKSGWKAEEIRRVLYAYVTDENISVMALLKDMGNHIDVNSSGEVTILPADWQGGSDDPDGNEWTASVQITGMCNGTLTLIIPADNDSRAYMDSMHIKVDAVTQETGTVLLLRYGVNGNVPNANMTPVLSPINIVYYVLNMNDGEKSNIEPRAAVIGLQGETEYINTEADFRRFKGNYAGTAGYMEKWHADIGDVIIKPDMWIENVAEIVVPAGEKGDKISLIPKDNVNRQKLTADKIEIVKTVMKTYGITERAYVTMKRKPDATETTIANLELVCVAFHTKDRAKTTGAHAPVSVFETGDIPEGSGGGGGGAVDSVNGQIGNVYLTAADVGARAANVKIIEDDLDPNIGFIKATVDNLMNYYKKTELYTKNEINSIIADKLSIVIAPALPDINDAELKAIYVVPRTNAVVGGQSTLTSDLCGEYMIVEDNGVRRWEDIGGVVVDLSNYFTKDEIRGMLGKKYDIPTGTGDSPIAGSEGQVPVINPDGTGTEWKYPYLYRENQDGTPDRGEPGQVPVVGQDYNLHLTKLTAEDVNADTRGRAQQERAAHNNDPTSHPEIVETLRAEIAANSQTGNIPIVDTIEEMDRNVSNQYVLSTNGMIYQSQKSWIPNFDNVLQNPDNRYRNNSGELSGTPSNPNMIVYTKAMVENLSPRNMVSDSRSPHNSTTGYIPVSQNGTIRIKGFDPSKLSSQTITHFCKKNGTIVDENGKYVNKYTIARTLVAEFTAAWTDVTTSDEQAKGIKAYEISVRQPTSFDAVIVECNDLFEANLNDCIITVNQKIENREGWTFVNTGVPYSVPQGDIDELRQKNTEQDERLSALENGNEIISLPEYWRTEADAKIAKFNTKANTMTNPIKFAWCSDAHISRTGDKSLLHLGNLAQYLKSQCQLENLVFCGDMTTGNSSNDLSKADMMASISWLQFYLGKNQEFAVIEGNHDIYYGSSGNNTYVYEVPPKEQFRKVFGPQHHDDYKVFGMNPYHHHAGLPDSPESQEDLDTPYFYEDYPSKKCRMVFCYSGDKKIIYSHGLTNHGGIGKDQRDWLSSDALKIPGGWSVILFVHVPPSKKVGTDTPDANNGSGVYYHDFDEFRTVLKDGKSEIEQKGGKFLGIFTGHLHADVIYDGKNIQVPPEEDSQTGAVTVTAVSDPSFDIPIFTVTCCGSGNDGSVAGNYGIQYKWSPKYIRKLGTATETAIDMVAIDSSTGEVYMQRVGAGADHRAYIPG